MVETEQLSTTRAIVQIDGKVAGEAVLTPTGRAEPIWLLELRGVTYRAFSLFGLRAKIDAAR
jgi:hypothetical protein